VKLTTAFATSVLFACLSAIAADKVATVHMAGDSTMAINDVKDYPETGWGVPFSIFFDVSVGVRN